MTMLGRFRENKTPPKKTRLASETRTIKQLISSQNVEDERKILKQTILNHRMATLEADETGKREKPKDVEENQNQERAREKQSPCSYVNRSDDESSPGLRQEKVDSENNRTYRQIGIQHCGPRNRVGTGLSLFDWQDNFQQDHT